MTNNIAQNLSDTNSLMKVLKNSIYDSSLILQLKILNYISKPTTQKEALIMESLLAEIKLEFSNFLQIMNIYLMIEFIKSCKNRDSTKMIKILESYKNYYDKDKLSTTSVEEFFIICNFIESFFAFFENIHIENLLFIREKLLKFSNSEAIIRGTLSDKFFSSLKRHSDISLKLIFDYYVIIIEYLILIKKPNILNNDLFTKISHFIVLLEEIKSKQLDNFDVMDLIENNVKMINANVSEDKDKIACFEFLLQEITRNPKLKEMQLVTTLYLTDQYYKQNNYKLAIEKIIPMIKLLKEEIYIEENSFGNKIEILDFLMLLFSRLINCFYYSAESENVLKYLKKLNKFISILKKTKILEKDTKYYSEREKSDITSLLNKYDCIVGLYKNILNFGLFGYSGNRKDCINNSLYSQIGNCNLNNNMSSKISAFENMLNFLEKYKLTGFKEFSLNQAYSAANLNPNSMEETYKIVFDKILNYFMINFEKQLCVSKDSGLLYKFYNNHIDFLKTIKIYLDSKILKIDLEHQKNNYAGSNKNQSFKSKNLLESHFYFIIGYYNLIYFYHNLLIYEIDNKRLENYFSNLNGLCDNFIKIFKEIFSPVLFTLNQRGGYEITPGGDSFSANNNYKTDTVILKLLIENHKIKNLLLKIVFIHINLFKYLQKYDQGLRVVEEYEKLLLNFDLKDEISETLYLRILNLKANYFMKTKNFITGINVYLEVLRILDKKGDYFIEDRATALFNTGFAYLIKLRNSVSENPNNGIYAKDDIKSIKSYLQESLNLFETIKYNRMQSSIELSKVYSCLI